MTIDDTNTKIVYGNSVCTNLNFENLESVTCDVESIEAGDQVPIILIDLYGYTSYAGEP